ncbi:MAG: DUF2849 domain-containing protein [Gammaproteobacteria bacterium]|jgi:hypothetical protein
MRMIIANRLTDGLVVFYTDEGGWSVDIADGAVITDEAAESEVFAAAKSDEENCVVIDPSLIEVTDESGSIRPVAIREAIRAFGPTV